MCADGGRSSLMVVRVGTHLFCIVHKSTTHHTTEALAVRVYGAWLNEPLCYAVDFASVLTLVALRSREWSVLVTLPSHAEKRTNCGCHIHTQWG